VLNLYSEYLTKEALEGFGDFKIVKLVKLILFSPCGA
jgi:hypothetical protein